jgi:hypothetical protein
MRARTGNPEFDRYLDWLKYQALAERIWARRGFYQASGAYGFRDQLQDAVNLIWVDPVLARRQILRHASQAVGRSGGQKALALVQLAPVPVVAHGLEHDLQGERPLAGELLGQLGGLPGALRGAAPGPAGAGPPAPCPRS